MSFRTAYVSSHPLLNRFFYRLWTDVVPTLLLLLVMAVAMGLVAHYVERSHFIPVLNDGVVIEQISG